MKKIIFVLLLIILTYASGFGQRSPQSTLMQLGFDIMENLQKFYPVLATSKGIHKYDFLFTDYSAKSIRTEIGLLKKFRSRLNQIKEADLAINDRIDLKLLRSNVEAALQDLERIKWHEKSPYLYVDNAVTGIYLIYISQHAPLSERAQNMIARMKLVPDLLAQAKLNLKRPAPSNIQISFDLIQTGIDFYRSLVTEIKDTTPELSSEADAAARRAIGAMIDFQKFLKRLPAGPPESFAIGKEEFDYKLKNEYFFDFDSDSLLKIGESLFQQYDSLYRDYELYLDSNRTPVDSIFVLDCVTKDDMLNYYNWEIEQTKLYLTEKEILTIPPDIGSCTAIETPVFLRNIISSIAYQDPGPFNPVQTGLFYVRPIPDSLDEGQRAAYFKFINRRGFKGSVVHEAYPGHHLQFMMSALVPDDIRRWQANNCYIEGWALYCEEMMYNQGFYGNDQRRYLSVLGGIRFRAARIIADVKLHTRQWTIDQTVSWMADALDSDSEFVRVEVNRYTLSPTVQMSYLMGKLDIMKLRDALRTAEGDAFSLRNFHDRYLSAGMVPPRLLWEEWNLK
ncbi:conserved hypothetical protein [Candidatus Zixiibacteriota bacterium]|nr:conserved hypothetical protein [candidate division Zixibacteria bacterium]